MTLCDAEHAMVSTSCPVVLAIVGRTSSEQGCANVEKSYLPYRVYRVEGSIL